MNKLNVIILAAGKGTRMVSNTPKVLHKIAGQPMLQHVISCAKKLNAGKIIVVVGFGAELVKQSFAHEPVIWVHQAEQLGTGHAVQQAVPFLDSDAHTLILLGDVPLVDSTSCEQLIAKAHSKLALLSFNKVDATGYGRIVRNVHKQVTAIVEHKDADQSQLAINEINTGIMAMPTLQLIKWLAQLDNNNVQAEYYLTDIIGFAIKDHVEVVAEPSTDEWAVTGINSKQDLAQIERVFQSRNATNLLKQGVTLADPARIDVRGRLTVAQDVDIDVGCIFEGDVSLGNAVKIGAYCVIKNTRIAANAVVAPYSHIADAIIGESARIGPFTRIRPGTVLQADTHVGNFVELKNSQVDVGSKINHLSYVGDAMIGKNVNIGAGTITCNYDGVNKFKTVIEDDVFIGSDTQLVAPVTINKGATIAAGSTITKDAPAGELSLSRGRQITVKGWKRPTTIKK